jgi:hypothetical protein
MSTGQGDGGSLADALRDGDALGPTVPRLLLGLQLHRLREAADVTPDAAASEIGGAGT